MRNKLPLLLQAELAECGLACLAMVLGYYQCHISLASLRKQIGSTARGVTLYQLKQLAESNGLIATVYRLTIEQLQTISYPCIAHWEMNHFVVIKKRIKNTLIVHDPLSGCKKVRRHEIQEKFTGIILDLRPSITFHKKQKEISKTHFLIIDWIKRHKATLFKLITISCFIQSAYIAGIFCIQKGVDYASNMQASKAQLFLIFFLGLQIIVISAEGLRSLLVIAMGTKLSHEFGVSVVKHLMNLPLNYFENRYMGSILSRFGALEKIRLLLTEGIIEGLVDGLASIIILICIYWINVKAGIIATFFSLAYLCIRVHANKILVQYSEEVTHFKSLEMSSLMEKIQAILSIKIFANEKNSILHWRNMYVQSLNAVTKLSWHKLYQDSIKNILFSVELIISVFVYYIVIGSDKMSMGVLYACLTYRQQFIYAISRLADKWSDFSLLAVAANRLDDIVEEPLMKELIIPEVLNKYGQWCVESVSFSYSESCPIILKNISLRISQGKILAITGASGSGKSTLLKIMMGLIKPTLGNVQLPRDLNKMAAVFQEDILMSGTIFENITFCELTDKIEWVEQCASMASISDEITQFPMGFNTLVGDRGLILSGGQKQRILLARALYTKPDILFLDEATSHLDIQNEKIIFENLKRLGLTTVMVAHRKETIEYADEVYHLC